MAGLMILATTCVRAKCRTQQTNVYDRSATAASAAVADDFVFVRVDSPLQSTLFLPHSVQSVQSLPGMKKSEGSHHRIYVRMYTSEGSHSI